MQESYRRITRLAIANAARTKDPSKKVACLQTATVASWLSSGINSVMDFGRNLVGGGNKPANTLVHPAPTPDMTGASRLTPRITFSADKAPDFSRFSQQQRIDLSDGLKAWGSYLDAKNQYANGQLASPPVVPQSSFDFTNLDQRGVSALQSHMQNRYHWSSAPSPTLAPPQPTVAGSAPGTPLEPIAQSPEPSQETSILERDKPPIPVSTSPPRPAGEWDQEAYDALREKYETMTRERRAALQAKIKELRQELGGLGPDPSDNSNVFSGTSPYLPSGRPPKTPSI